MHANWKAKKNLSGFFKSSGSVLGFIQPYCGLPFFLDHKTASEVILCTILASSFTRINVLLFFMISGALLLGKDYSYKDLLGRRIPRFAAVLFIASMLLYTAERFGDFDLLQPKIQGRLPEKVLTGISSLTLGIYLIDPFLKDHVHLFDKMEAWFGGAIHVLPLSVLYCIVSMAIGGTITWILKKLPVTRKFL